MQHLSSDLDFNLCLCFALAENDPIIPKLMVPIDDHIAFYWDHNKFSSSISHTIAVYKHTHI